MDISTLLTRKGSHAETKDENSVSFQMFLILLSFITLGLESQISVFEQCQSNSSTSGVFWEGGGACAEAKNWIFFSEKNFIRHFVWFNFSRLSLAFI